MKHDFEGEAKGRKGGCMWPVYVTLSLATTEDPNMVAGVMLYMDQPWTPTLDLFRRVTEKAEASVLALHHTIVGEMIVLNIMPLEKMERW
jgi:hypothetical protein